MANETLEAPPAPPPPTTSIKVGAMPTTAEPSPPPKPGSARERLFSELRKKAKPGTFEDQTPTEEPKPQSPAPKPQQPTQSETHEGETESPTPGEGEEPQAEPSPTAKPDAASPTTPEEKKKVSPWKLVDQLKKDLIEARKTNALPEEERKGLMERASKAETRIKEMEEELRWYNSEKYDPDIKKAQEDYDRAWANAMGELKELTVTDATGERPISPQDMLDLVNMPLQKAREVADQVYGAFADDVMAHRKEIRKMFEAKATRTEELKKTASQREQQRKEQHEKFMSEAGKQVKEIWDKANESIAKDEKIGRWVKPVEGNEEINQRLAKGFELVDRAFSENPMDPRLTNEQRVAVVKRHAAIRNRAATWGRVVFESGLKDQKIEALEKELAQYRASTPTTGGEPQKTQPNGAPAKASDTVYGALRKLAK